MPPTLHPHLKRGLHLDEYSIDPREAIEAIPANFLDTDTEAAKRRRIEKIASQYLQGKRPVILSAGLRGPFNSSWKNPWKQANNCGRRVARKESCEIANKTRLRRRSTALSPEHVATRSCTSINAQHEANRYLVASPEASRAAGNDLESQTSRHDLDIIQGPAPLLDNREASGTTQFFSVDAEQGERFGSPRNNAFWLRRADPRARADLDTSSSCATETSPSRTRSGVPHSVTTELELSVPSAPLARTRPSRAEVRGNVTPRFPIPTLISSPVVLVPDTYKELGAPRNTERELDNTSTLQSRSLSLSAQTVQMPLNELPKAVTLAASQPRSPARDSHTLNNDFSTSDTRLGVALGIDKPENTPEFSKPKISVSTNPCDNVGMKTLPMHGVSRSSLNALVASPTPQSSTEFHYKKISGTKWNISNAPRSKPRAINFNSSPAMKLHALSVTGVTKSSDHSSQHPTQHKVLVEHRDEEGADVQSTRVSRESEYSTQAAMLLAQIEFHESTFPQSAIDIPQPRLQHHDPAPRSELSQQSHTMTPLSTLQAQMAPPQPLDSGHCGPPMSTQDLFAAASPFALSTVKKKPEANHIGGQRVVTIPYDKMSETVECSVPSTATLSGGRKPKEQKSLGATPQSFTLGEDSQAIEPSAIHSVRSGTGAVKLPQLDFHTSLDDYGQNDSFTLADHFLRNLNEI